VVGADGSIMEGMSYTFTGENSYIDQIMAGEGATLIFDNHNPSYGCGVSYDGGIYRTVGFSFELGGLSDGEYTRDDVMIAILEFFGITGVWTATEERPVAESGSVNAYPNPAGEITNISVTVNSSCRVILEIFDLNGRRIATLHDGNLAGGMHKFEWSGSDGVYFYRLQAGKEVSTGKIVRY
jgi:hypothetical protein